MAAVVPHPLPSVAGFPSIHQGVGAAPHLLLAAALLAGHELQSQQAAKGKHRIYAADSRRHQQGHDATACWARHSVHVFGEHTVAEQGQAPPGVTPRTRLFNDNAYLKCTSFEVLLPSCRLGC
jgi:hypothetical protein